MSELPQSNTHKQHYELELVPKGSPKISFSRQGPNKDSDSCSDGLFLAKQPLQFLMPDGWAHPAHICCLPQSWDLQTWEMSIEIFLKPRRKFNPILPYPPQWVLKGFSLKPSALSQTFKESRLSSEGGSKDGPRREKKLKSITMKKLFLINPNLGRQSINTSLKGEE